MRGHLLALGLKWLAKTAGASLVALYRMCVVVAIVLEYEDM